MRQEPETITTTITTRATLPEVEQAALSWPSKAEKIEIANDEDYKKAADTKVAIRELKQKIEADEKPNIDRWAQGLAKAREHRDWLTKPLDRAIEILTTKLKAYLDQKERARQAEERKIQEALRAQAEEAKRKKAIEQMNQGNVQGAIDTVSKPVDVPTVRLAPHTPKVAGIKVQKRWHAEIEDMGVFLLWIAQNHRNPQTPGVDPDQMASLDLVEPNMPELNRRARNLKDKLRIPGVKAVEETVL